MVFAMRLELERNPDLKGLSVADTRYGPALYEVFKERFCRQRLSREVELLMRWTGVNEGTTFLIAPCTMYAWREVVPQSQCMAYSWIEEARNR
jgi:hypothetical protein